MRHYTLAITSLCLCLFFTACSKAPKFKVEGQVKNAKGEIMYFELFGINKTDILDSIKLNDKGFFHFKSKVPDYPEFYRLRIGNRFITLGIDSAQNIKVDAEYKNFGKDYSVKGSRSCEQIRELSLQLDRTIQMTDSLKTLYESKQLTTTEYQDKFKTVLNSHKAQASKIIYENPRSTASYFAIFQRIKNYLIFDPYDKDDNRHYAAVATSWNAFYPNAIRSKNLVNLTLEGLKEIRAKRDENKIVVHKQNSISFFEIELPDIYDKTMPLSSLRGKVVLLDFTAYQSKSSVSQNLYFRNIYRKYVARGFEIYQVSLDTDEHFWKTSAANLPWICVHDKNNVQSKYLSTYNVQKIPTYFLINRKGIITMRDIMISDLNKEIGKLL